MLVEALVALRALRVVQLPERRVELVQHLRRTRRAVQFHYSRRGAKTTTDEERLSRFASAES